MGNNNPLPKPGGDIYLTDAGVETYLMYKKSFELPNFSLFHLLNDTAATHEIREYYRKRTEVAVKHEAGMIFCGIHYRASKDWGDLLGYSEEGLAEINFEAIDLYRGLADTYRAERSPMLISGCIGPRGDAYQRNQSMSLAEAEDYHSAQIITLKKAGADFVTALTFNNTLEVIGIVRAAQSVGIPVVASFTLNTEGRLEDGKSLKEAMQVVDTATGSAPAYYMINCTHPNDFGSALELDEVCLRLNGIRPNASPLEKGALCQLGHLEEGNPVELGTQLGFIAQKLPHISVWGGCCGTDYVHVDEICRKVTAARASAV